MHNCHHCQGLVADGLKNCPHCNIEQPPIIPNSGYTNPNIKIYTAEDTPSYTLSEWLLFDKHQDNSAVLIIRAVFYIALFMLSIKLLMTSVEDMADSVWFLHAINTPFHEAGHVIFRPFGQYITSLGGSLGQVLMPFICFVSLLFKNRDPFGATIALWWMGENFLDMSPYINDARALELPLLGGNVGHSSPYGFHDWEYLLTEANIIEYDTVIAKLAFFTGSIIILTALIWAAIILFKQYQRINA